MWKKLLALVLAGIFTISAAVPVHADNETIEAAQMHEVLEKYHSPMSRHETVLIDTAKQYGLDWTLLAAIAGTESSFGLYMPGNCINPYGWGIYGDNEICFKSFDDAAAGLAAGLSAGYNTTSVRTIAYTYNHVSTGGWLAHTESFMDQIKNAPVPVSALPITL